MRLSYILVLAAVALFPASIHAQWEAIDSGVTVNLHDIQFVRLFALSLKAGQRLSPAVVPMVHAAR